MQLYYFLLKIGWNSFIFIQLSASSFDNFTPLEANCVSFNSLTRLNLSASCGGQCLNRVNRHSSKLSVPEVPLRYLFSCILIGWKYKLHLFVRNSRQEQHKQQCFQEFKWMKVSWKTEVSGSLNKRLWFTGNYYDYEMCCFKRRTSVPKRLIDSNAWFSLNCSLELQSP